MRYDNLDLCNRYIEDMETTLTEIAGIVGLKKTTPERLVKTVRARMEYAGARDSALRKIRDALDLDGAKHAGHNLDGAVIDAVERGWDKVCEKTCKRVLGQLAEVIAVLNALEPPGVGVSLQPTDYICVACDGCGWCEGSPAFKCERCNGTGRVPNSFGLCEGCPPAAHKDATTRCAQCPRREEPPKSFREIPEGWKLVPVEPTDDMLGELYGSAILPASLRAPLAEAWRDTLAAAPECEFQTGNSKGEEK